jgi:tetratricopeptide (TPR) repeat protein
MTLLRLTQSTVGPDQYQILVELTGPDIARQTVTAPLTFALTAQDRRDLRWYFEDYLQVPFAPEQQIAARIEARLAAIGVELFRAVFQADDDARDLWATLRERLAGARVEVVSGVHEAASIPWELLRDPKTDATLALRARAFVRAQPQAAQRPVLPAQAQPGEAIRVLLVICRPGAGDDVPFRSVASRLIKGLSDAARARFQLDVLRPPTFARLGQALRQARDDGRPYHVVHFDGHGLYAQVKDRKSVLDLLRGLTPLLLAGPDSGAHGYLVFENPALEDNAELVKGDALGRLLAEAGAPVLVLNACRSAHADPTPAPRSPAPRSPAPADVHSAIRAYGSLAQEVMDQGVAGVVAMGYNVYVVTAAQFVADLYAGLARGQSLGEAVSQGRQQLHAQPLRTIAYEPIPLQDWPVPVVYEAAPIRLFPPATTADGTPLLAITAGESATARGSLDPSLPPPPEVGFFGRDETLLALDRAFDTERVVLLHAYAGSGKTATAAEFARWYAGTGGVDGPVLWTSFEQHQPLPRVLDQLGALFEPALAQAGINWLALPERKRSPRERDRRDVALDILRQVPVLWIWDNVEPVAGFPAGSPSQWSAQEQRELADFLRAAQGTQARFLLTSRRDERGWLGENWPRRVAIPPMPMQERVQLAQAIAARRGRRLGEVEDWQPLLRYSQGNPLALTVLVGEALRQGLRSQAQVGAFVAQLRAGEAPIEDDETQGRSKSLAASLSYGFGQAFDEEERRQLALLHLFQGFVDVDALTEYMGNPDFAAFVNAQPGAAEPFEALPELRGLTREAGIHLLDRAAEIGLLTAHGGGYYSIHPALPWYFKALFDQYFGERLPVSGERLPVNGERSEGAEPLTDYRLPVTDHRLPVTDHRSPSAERAYVEAMGELGAYYHAQYQDGNRDVIDALQAEEANLLHARRLARQHGWWPRVISAMQGLRALYGHLGRRAAWAGLVAEITPDFVDPASDGPRPGREEQWSFVTQYRVRLAREARRWPEAERLQRARVERDRQRAAASLALPANALDDAGRNAIRTLAVSLGQLSDIQREQGRPDCAATSQEAIALYQSIDDRAAEASRAFNLGHAYKNLPGLRDLDEAERWYKRGLELTDERDRLQRGKGFGTLAGVAYERFLDAREAGQPEAALLRHLNAAAGYYYQALDLLPPNAVDDLAVTHNQLGNVYDDAGDLERALRHWRESIRYRELAGDIYWAGAARLNIAGALANAGRLADARDYAQAALRDFEPYGAGAAADVEKTQRLIADIQAAMR